jgi:hypothetical protein
VTPVPPHSQTGQLSPDGRWRWNGTEWVPAQPAPPVPPGTPAGPPFPAAGPFRTPSPLPGGLAYQFSGHALWSIIFGAASVLVPLFTPIYFPILPIFGLWRGVVAIRSGRVTGGVIGLIINVFGCLVSLLSSGLLH